METTLDRRRAYFAKKALDLIDKAKDEDRTSDLVMVLLMRLHPEPCHHEYECLVHGRCPRNPVCNN